MIKSDKILQELILTEKTNQLSSNSNQYVFKVSKDSTRKTVAMAVESNFGVKVVRVNTLNVKPKAKVLRSKRVQKGHIPGYKKAFVRLKQGESIELI